MIASMGLTILSFLELGQVYVVLCVTISNNCHTLTTACVLALQQAPKVRKKGYMSLNISTDEEEEKEEELQSSEEDDSDFEES